MFKGLDNRMRIICGNLYDPDKEDSSINWTECLLDDFKDTGIGIVAPSSNCTVVFTEDGINLAIFSDNSFFFIGHDIWLSEVLTNVKIDMDQTLLEPSFQFTFKEEDESYTLFLNFKSLLYQTFTNRMIPTSPKKVTKVYALNESDLIEPNIWEYWYSTFDKSDIGKIQLDCGAYIFHTLDYKGLWIGIENVLFYVGREEIFTSSKFLPIVENENGTYLSIEESTIKVKPLSII